MKKVLFMLLCCTVFFIGCNNAPQEEQVVDTQEIDATADVPSDTIASSTETVNNEQPAQDEGETK